MPAEVTVKEESGTDLPPTRIWAPPPYGQPQVERAYPPPFHPNLPSANPPPRAPSTIYQPYPEPNRPGPSRGGRGNYRGRGRGDGRGRFNNQNGQTGRSRRRNGDANEDYNPWEIRYQTEAEEVPAQPIWQTLDELFPDDSGEIDERQRRSTSTETPKKRAGSEFSRRGDSPITPVGATSAVRFHHNVPRDFREDSIAGSYSSKKSKPWLKGVDGGQTHIVSTFLQSQLLFHNLCEYWYLVHGKDAGRALPVSHLRNSRPKWLNDAIIPMPKSETKAEFPEVPSGESPLILNVTKSHVYSWIFWGLRALWESDLTGLKEMAESVMNLLPPSFKKDGLCVSLAQQYITSVYYARLELRDRSMNHGGEFAFTLSIEGETQYDESRHKSLFGPTRQQEEQASADDDLVPVKQRSSPPPGSDNHSSEQTVVERSHAFNSSHRAPSVARSEPYNISGRESSAVPRGALSERGDSAAPTSASSDRESTIAPTEQAPSTTTSDTGSTRAPARTANAIVIAARIFPGLVRNGMPVVHEEVLTMHHSVYHAPQPT